MKGSGLPVRARPLHGHDFFRDVLDDFYAMRRGLGSRYADVWQPPTDIYETDRWRSTARL